MVAERQQPSKFRVIIAGGGIAGLTLANCLQHANIDFILLEARNIIAPQVGASIGIGPSGSRILDQLECYDDVLDKAAPIRYSTHHYEDGTLLGPPIDSLKLLGIRSGYEVAFLDRQYVLEVLYNHLHDRSKVLLGKRLEKVEHSADGITVYCADGSSYTADVVAGCDGVHSVSRLEMWRLAGAASGHISENDKKALTAEYKVLFGISSSCNTVKRGDYDVTHTQGLSTILIGGRDGVAYWFVFKRMDKVYKTGEIPKFTTADAENFAKEISGLHLKPGGSLVFGDLWETRKSAVLVPTEEASFDTWTFGRIACLGDSIHKVTPNMGAGGNAAMESAAGLANALKGLVDEHPSGRPSFEAVKGALSLYEKSRKITMKKLIPRANSLTRIHALASFMDRIVAFYIAPFCPDFLADLAAPNAAGALKIDYLPPPARSLDVPMPFNPTVGPGREESKLWRACFALPLLGLAYIAYQRVRGDVIPLLEPLMVSVLQSGTLQWGSTSVAIRETFFRVKWLDDVLRPQTAIFVPSQTFETISSWQVPMLLADYGLIYSIWLIESARRNNTFSPFRLPILYVAAQGRFGFAAVAPLYFFLHFVLNPMQNFLALDMRLTNLVYTRAVLPVMAVFYYIPLYMSYAAESIDTRQSWMWLFASRIIWLPLGQEILSRTVMPDTMVRDRIQNPRADLPTIYFTLATVIGISSTVWLYTISSSPFPLMTLLFPSAEESAAPTFAGLLRTACQNEYLYGFFAAAELWIVYLFTDLKKAGMVDQSWLTLLASLVVSTLAVGPGATVGLGWVWREYILAHRKHKAAIVRKKPDVTDNKSVANGSVKKRA